MRQRIYLDTSVISALDDHRQPERSALTRDFWIRLQDFVVCTSDAARKEIADTPDMQRRGQMLNRLSELSVLPLTDEMRLLGRQYVDAGVFPEGVLTDALHVAAAVLMRCDILVSWNFKHLVNRRRRAAVASINAAQGLPTIEIIAPPEV